jgi:hypothetical protein
MKLRNGLPCIVQLISIPESVMLTLNQFHYVFCFMQVTGLHSHKYLSKESSLVDLISYSACTRQVSLSGLVLSYFRMIWVAF